MTENTINLFDFIYSSHSNPMTSEFKRGDIIFHEGDNPDHLCLVEKGLVGLFHYSETGKETFLRVFGNKSICGLRSFFANEAYQGSAIALKPTQLLLISKKECEQLCTQHPELLKKVTQLLAIDLGIAESRLAGLQDKSAHLRTVETLIFLKEKYPDQVWTRKEIAEYAGTTFETVTRTMSSLEKEGHITKVGRDFSFTNIQYLLDKNF
ncbi:MAG: hypothetical protein CME62_06515 [Halobacteriovoraceae bacterium]|nr:hypothetical protein [Halobacteriovoraceae bacterium]|tara:strand:- start:19185 stop:19811 length:627 start_codon:yes stop_codon:yes gene_type:complete